MAAPYFVSSVPYFKAALKARLEAVAALSTGNTTIARGNPYPVAWGWEAVIIGAATNRMRTPAAAMTQVNEEYDVEIFANRVSNPQDPHEDNEDRVYEIIDAVEGSLWEWATASSPLVSGTWGHVDMIRIDPAHDIEGMQEDPQTGKVTSRDASVVLPVHVTARLTRNG